MDALDQRILTIVQSELPVAARPYAALAARVEADEATVIARLGAMLEAGLVRRLGPVFDSKRLGYLSTLVAARVPAERLETVAGRAGAEPGVTHNYAREGPYNLWFTLTAPSDASRDATLAALAAETGVTLHQLPARAVYKIRVVFDLTGQGEVEPAPPPRLTEAAALDARQKALVRAMQDGLAVESEPFVPVAEAAGWTVEAVLAQVRGWIESGVIRRFGAVVGHRKVGMRANGMGVFALAADAIDAAGRHLAARPEITHCYRRPRLPDFPYELYAMIHGADEGAVRDLARRLAEEIGAEDWDVLFSVREFKKTSMRYFV